jgi:glycosyltransferase involved in cell wall biosynthesis
MRILYVVTDLIIAGAQFQVLYLARHFRSLGWDIHVVSLVSDVPLLPEFENHGIRVSTLNMKNGVPDPRGILKLANIIQKWRPDIVNSHMVHANLLARITRLFVKMPALICTAHNIFEGGRRREIAYHLTDSLCDITVNVSRAGAERAVQVGSVPADRVLVIHPGVDATRFQSNQSIRLKTRETLGVDAEFTWIAVGRFVENKDYPTMLQAFARFANKHPDSCLLIVGAGPLQEMIEQKVGELGVSDAVQFLGVRRDIPALMAASNAYLMSSAWEGLPAVLLEASASGLPIVATDVGGNREAVVNGQTGHLVPAKDPSALADAMCALKEMSISERQELGSRARAYFDENFSIAKVADKWGDLYHQYFQVDG